MNINDNYIANLQRKPSYPKYKGFHWADYIELLCLANIDGEVSIMDIIDRLAEREEDLYESDPDDLEEMKNLEEEDTGIPTQRYKKHDKWIERVNSWFEIIKFRKQHYKTCYPFDIEKDDLILKYNSDNIKHKYYLFLLLCSNLFLLKKQISELISSYFEVISLQALKNLLPTNASVVLFGSNPLNDNPRYGKTATCLNKIKNLASDLNEKLSPNFNEESYPENNYGDDGLDLVAWLHTGDDQNSNIIVLGQCACTVDWIDKQSSSSYEAWDSKISLTTMTINAIFIPFCYRNPTGNWFDSSKIRKSFLVDRKRTLYFLDDSHEIDTSIVNLIDSLLKTKEPIF
ncbi:MAG: hypothetical protein H6557_17650 [Lewinellaceae bacterium]|nr:hypothetical protein [Phaeodactylibacter sp.]MCB9038443.1 hypothetical protein [Lewinellaceae bacterium]